MFTRSKWVVNKSKSYAKNFARLSLERASSKILHDIGMSEIATNRGKKILLNTRATFTQASL